MKHRAVNFSRVIDPVIEQGRGSNPGISIARHPVLAHDTLCHLRRGTIETLDYADRASLSKL